MSRYRTDTGEVMGPREIIVLYANVIIVSFYIGLLGWLALKYTTNWFAPWDTVKPFHIDGSA